jgi:formyltetrahydrofolate deformylase
VETDFRARSAGSPTLGAGSRADGRHADTGRLLITGPDRPGIAAAVSASGFRRGAGITGPRRYSPDPFGYSFLLRIEWHLTAPGGRSANLAGGFGELAGGFPGRGKMAVRG